MFAKLRLKFTAIVAAMVGVVIIASFTAICVSEQQKDYTAVMEELQAAADKAWTSSIPSETTGLRTPTSVFGYTDGSEDDGTGDETKTEIGGSTDSASTGSEKHSGWSYSIYKQTSTSGASDSNENAEEGSRYSEKKPSMPNIGGYGDVDALVVPIAVYCRYDDGTVEEISDAGTASIEETTLEIAAACAYVAAEDCGTLSDVGLHYAKRSVSGRTYMAFADVASTSSWQSLAFALAGFGAGAVALLTLLAWFLSGWALKPVKSAWDSQKQFVADASHDLKTPITVVLANMSILKKHGDRQVSDEMQWIDNTEEESSRMLSLVNEMLKLASVEEMAKGGYEFSDVGLSEVVESMSLSLDALAMEKDVESDLECEEGIVVSGDEGRLSNMLGTIAENAFKYVDAGGHVSISLSKEKKSAVVRISNTGAPIPPEDLEHIFDRFYRSDKARTSGVGGFGLGLAIAKETAKAHGGDITAASGEDGTEFVVTLPLKKK